MIDATTSADGQVLLLLCSSLGLPRGTKPLGLAEWNQVAAAMTRASDARPADLLGKSAMTLASELGVQQVLADRIASLLSRGGQLALELDRMASRGIWTLTRADADYPARLRQRLKQHAPPVLFGAGAAPSPGARALAIVGSRDVDEAGLVFAKRLARSCAEGGFVVVSGGARGTDSVAQEEVLDAGGVALAVLADSLERSIQRRAILGPVRAGRLTLVTPFHPATPFSVGTAMGRNRLIYCLSDGAVVVSSAAEEGGTWAGAVENLDRGWVTLYVRSSADMPAGNAALLNKGAHPLMSEQVASAPALQASMDADMFPDESKPRDSPSSIAREDLFGSMTSDQTPPRPQSMAIPDVVAPLPATPAAYEAADVYTLVIERLQSFCREPRTADEIASVFSIERSQAKVWLTRAVKEGALHKRTKPVRYVAANRTLFTS